MDYQAVIKDFKSGTLDKNKVTLVMDNDDGYWMVDADNDDLADEQVEQLEKKYGTPDGYADIIDVLMAAGVPCEWC